MKSILMKNWFFYIMGLVIVIGLKYYYRTAGVNDLCWILAPTAWWSQILSGNTFEWAPSIGYINHSNEFIIAGSCSGVNYLIILFSTLLYSFMHRWDTFKQKLLWFLTCIVLAYILTIGVNGLRVVIAMYLFHADIYGGMVTPERVHSIEGIILFFGSLFTIYMITDRAVGRLKGRKAGQNRSVIGAVLTSSKYPVLCYFILTLGIPILDGAYKKDISKFLEHTAVILLICTMTISMYWLSILIKRKLRQNG